MIVVHCVEPADHDERMLNDLPGMLWRSIHEITVLVSGILQLAPIVFVGIAALAGIRYLYRTSIGDDKVRLRPIVNMLGVGFGLYVMSFVLPSITARLAEETTGETVNVPAVDWSALTVPAVIAVAASVGITGIVAFVRHRLNRRRRRLQNDQDVSAIRTRWDEVRAEHQSILRKITHAETDWDTLFSMPALSDISVPETAALFRAMRAVSDIGDDMPEGITSLSDVASLPYPQAVADFAHAWDVAYRTAERIGTSDIPIHERKMVERITSLLNVARDAASTENERDLAYQQVHAIARQLRHVVIPKPTMAMLETQSRLSLEPAEMGGR